MTDDYSSRCRCATYIYRKARLQLQHPFLPTQSHTVLSRSVPIRLQEYGVGHFPNALTKSALKKAIKKGWVTVDGKVASTATWIRGGELICLSIPDETPAGKKLIFPLEIIWEDEYLAMIHKPAGILVSGNSFKTITNALVQNLAPSHLTDAAKPQPVHRLDYPTTGILLVGKTNSSIRALNRLFAEKQITKTYFAVTIGKMDKQGIISTEIDGKPAQSHYQVQSSVASSRFQELNLLKLQPQTGRRHQLRKHLAGIGHPILGDKDYGKDGLILQGKGLYLHAHSLQFEHPFTGEQLHISAALPLRFRKLFPGFK